MDRYEEALEKIREGLAPKDGCEISGVTRAFLEEVFPELRESEDERIRKELIAYHRSMAAAMNGNRPYVHEAWIAWLEKQGEQKPINDTDEEIVEAVKNTSVLDMVEQEPIKWKRENVEDLTEFENAMMHIGGSFFGENAGLDPNDTQAIKEQAKYLMGFAQKPTAWSEEDERIIKRIDSLLYSQCKIHGSEYEKIHNWLKSFRPQKQWKPNHEQMLQLSIAMERGDYNGFVLKSLYNELKQLQKSSFFPSKDHREWDNEGIRQLYAYNTETEYDHRIKANSQPHDYPEVFDKIYEKLCEIQGKMGDIYEAASKYPWWIYPYPQSPQPLDPFYKQKGWTITCGNNPQTESSNKIDCEDSKMH